MSSSNTVSQMSEANCTFLTSLYKTILKDKPDENIFFSPISISVALSMTLVGAKGNTYDQIKKTLGFDTVDEKELHLCFKTLVHELTGFGHDQKDVSVSIANGLFVQEEFQLLQPFVNTVQEMYNAVSKNVDFRNNSEDATKQVNGWVKDVTRDKIPQLFDDVDPNTVLIIVNAIYFKSLWTHKFEPGLTKLSDFHLNKNETVQVKMMQLEEDLRYTVNDAADCHVLELPYKDGKTSMVIFLPKKVDGLAKIESLISPEFIKDCLSKLNPPWAVNVQLPCFKLEESYSLGSVLKDMGMADLFVPHLANLRGIAQAQDLFVSEVIHKSVVEVNEEGTEAAAATGIQFVLCCAKIPISVKADHPFMFCIVDSSSSSILFIGSLKKPKPA